MMSEPWVMERCTDPVAIEGHKFVRRRLEGLLKAWGRMLWIGGETAALEFLACSAYMQGVEDATRAGRIRREGTYEEER